MTDALPHARTLLGAIVAGLLAGVTILACFAILTPLLLPAAGFSLAGMFTFTASTLIGKAAYSSGSSIALGAALHFLVAIGWAVGYAIVAERQPQLLTRPVTSGAAFGLIVYFAMQLVLVAANSYHIPTPRELAVALVAHIACYGMPVAFIIARLHRPK